MDNPTKYLTEGEQAKIVFYEGEIRMLSSMIKRTANRREKLEKSINKIRQQVQVGDK